MAEVAEKDKRYYWLKFTKDFFKRHDVQIIEKMPNGKEYVLFYAKLLCESVDHEGNLRFSDTLPYDEAMLAAITNTDEDIVKQAIEIFSQFHLVEIMDDGTYFMTKVPKMLGSETYWAKKKREQRVANAEEVGQIPTKSNESPTCPSKSKRKSKRIDKDIKNINSDSTEPEPPAPKKTKPVKHKYGEYKNVLLTDEELQKLKTEYSNDWQKRIENLSGYVESTGKKYKSHYATIRTWARKDKEQKPVRKEMVPSWMQGEKHDYDFEALEKEALGVTVANDPTLAERAEALQQRLKGNG